MSFVTFIRAIYAATATIFFMPRLDCCMFGRHFEKKDMGFVSYVCFLHMEVNQTHPIMLVFCELLFKSLQKDNKDLQNFKTPKQIRLRNKWLVLYTLIKNPYLKKQRKIYIKKTKSKIENLFYFMRRKFKSYKKEIKEAEEKF